MREQIWTEKIFKDDAGYFLRITKNAVPKALHNMTRKTPDFLLSAAVLGGVILLVVAGGIYSFQEQPETVQGMVEVTDYRVAGKVPGRIARLFVKEGDLVAEGDTVALLEAPEVEAKLQQAEAAASAADAMSRKANRGAREEQIQAAYEMWQKAKAGREICEKSYGRVNRLFEQGVMTAQKRDETKAQLDAAISTEGAAKAQYELVLHGAQAEDRDAAGAQANRAQGAVNEVRSYLKETVLRAPHAGEISEIFPETGELVGTGAPVMTISDMNEPWVAFHVREDLLNGMEVNQQIRAVIPALGNKEVTLKVRQIRDMGSYSVWKATKTTGQFDRRTFEVKADFTKPIKGLRAGMSVLLVGA